MVWDQEVVMSHPVVKVVVEVMVDNIMHWKVRYKLVMGLMMDHLSKKFKNWSLSIISSEFLYLPSIRPISKLYLMMNLVERFNFHM